MKNETKTTIKKIHSLIENKAKNISKLEKEKAEKEKKLAALREKFGDIVLNGDSSSYNEAKYQIEFLQYSVDALNDKIKKEQSLTDAERTVCQSLMYELRDANNNLPAETLAKVHEYTSEMRRIKNEADSDFQEIMDAKNALSHYTGGQLNEFTPANPTGMMGSGELREIFKAFKLF